MPPFKAGVIGCGGRGKAHARGYTACPDTTITACSDPVPEAAAAFAGDFSVSKTYADYRDMLAQEELDIVSVCTWTGLHRDMIVEAARSGVKAIHSEKPIAPTWGESKEIFQACQDNGIVITFCHQRRFGAHFVKARDLVAAGAIGKLTRLEGACPNLFDWGTHWFDMFNFYNGDGPADWVMGQIAVEEHKEVFGVRLDTSGLAWIRWQNGVEGLLATGGAQAQGFHNRLIGTEGIIDVGRGQDAPVRILRAGSGWEAPEFEPQEHDDTVLSVFDLAESLRQGREPELSGRKAMQATEMIFATYESSRRRSRIKLPLDVDDSALLTMIKEGTIGKKR
jgi:UDP-N-acetylglucosamine 3-dehydrogenase